jgi:protein-S-isoprenylcysteine O-methyltransferase Ste14
MGTLLLVLASGLWGFIHSVTASLKMKEAVQKTFGVPLMNGYRLFYNFVSVITFFPILILTAWLPDSPLYSIPEPWVIVTEILQLFAVIILAIGVLQTDVWSFIGLSQITGRQSKGNIVTGGLYKYVRHPLYSAGLVFLWLTPVMTVNRLALYLCLTLYIFIGANFEERKLIREFGQDYLDYKSRTPMVFPLPVRSKD